MNISIHYYSGAGNTKHIAKKLEQAFKRDAHIVHSVKISKESNARGVDADFDMLGIGFPIYFREAPELVSELLKSLDSQKKPIFFFTTKGMYSGNALRNLMEVAKERNFQNIGFIEFFMPGTDFLILFAKKNSLMEHSLKRIHSRQIDQKIDHFVASITKNSSVKMPPKKWYTFLDDRIVKYFEDKYDNHHRAYIGQFYSDPETCTQCMRCVNGCPQHNIVLNGQIRFGLDCDVCFNCVHNCPTESIQIGEITQENARYKKVELY
jgi:flavodoxin/ferredoxin